MSYPGKEEINEAYFWLGDKHWSLVTGLEPRTT